MYSTKVLGIHDALMSMAERATRPDHVEVLEVGLETMMDKQDHCRKVLANLTLEDIELQMSADAAKKFFDAQV